MLTHIHVTDTVCVSSYACCRDKNFSHFFILTSLLLDLETGASAYWTKSLVTEPDNLFDSQNLHRKR